MEPKDFKFEDHKSTLPQIMLEVEVLDVDGLPLLTDPLNLNLVIGYSDNTANDPVVYMDNFKSLSPHIRIRPPGEDDPKYLKLGYKAFGKWVTESGKDMRADVNSVKKILQKYTMDKWNIEYYKIDGEPVTKREFDQHEAIKALIKLEEAKYQTTVEQLAVIEGQKKTIAECHNIIADDTNVIIARETKIDELNIEILRLTGLGMEKARTIEKFQEANVFRRIWMAIKGKL